MANATVILEKATPYRLRYRVDAVQQKLGGGGAAAQSMIGIPNAAGTTPDIQTDLKAGTGGTTGPLYVEMLKTLETSSVDLPSYLQNHPNVEVKLIVEKAYAAVLGTDQYITWFVELLPTNGNLFGLNVAAPSCGGIAIVEIAYLFSEID